ncbi:heavy metal translocating P-type ATPase [Pseudomonas schmalbachii]|uniref:P-type Zn(2+) transporter n=1 Tax=Pseudomonas schmalbachii TaxID=2816993 RepID=A0ABS3TMJ9_9PSED|nr:heavy metal translocating P-type ATPase [Pseudomonas schmalbachii]MBO3273915.1 heavy metal translocating P-type ATPase [Pseudomonas schmalbachii]
MSGAWFAALELVHDTAGRARYRYRCQPGRSGEPRRIEWAIEALRGVRKVRVNPGIHALIVEFEDLLVDAEALRQAILTMEYPDFPLSQEHARGHGAVSPSGVLTTGAALFADRRLQPELQGPLSVAVSMPLFGKALAELMERGVTSHVLEALAVAISISRRDFLTANTTTFLLAVGDYLEHSIERHSDNLLKSLLRPASSEVWVERDGVEQLVDAREVMVGDTVIAATGTVIPIDGTVLGGEALVNQATMTGESVPVARRRGDNVLSGTLIEEGRLRIYAEKVGRHAAAARIANYVEQSLAVKSATQLEASRLADRLVPMVLGLAGGTWLLSQNLQRVSAVLQADYSCALKLATPVAFKASMYQAGRRGVLVKGANALERLAEADTFVFDKTGTLTTGALRVTDSLVCSAGYTAEDVINIAASVEEHYYHPMAMAVVDAASRLAHRKHFNHEEVQFIVAHGVASVIDGKRIVVGSRHFVEEDEGISTAAYADDIERLRREGKTLLYIGYGGELLGVLGMLDSVHPDSAATIARLREQGVKRIIMLTGDHPERAQALADELNLDGFRAGLLPDEKAEAIKELADEGAHIAFVGDGINDAPALSGAHVGISMCQGSDIARLASDITLLEEGIAGVADVKAIAIAARDLINSNFRLIVGLNTSILVAASFGLLTPVSASMLHNGSTIAILLRALAGSGMPGGSKTGEGSP